MAEAGGGRRYVILDRDGTLNVEREYLSDPELVELLPGVVEGLRYLRKLHLGLVVVSNQSGVGRGYFDLERVGEIHLRLESLLRQGGITLDGIYCCPHSPLDGCDCRKPKPGLVERAARELQFDPHRSFLIGDQACDMELGRVVGAVNILVTTGYGAQTNARMEFRPDFVVDSLLEGAQVIERLLE
ncbi:MAG: HAD family hydrolase [Acidobacteria bacterium]|nr:HAD family hydrolase [Acidobacteriota bacterium]